MVPRRLIPTFILVALLLSCSGGSADMASGPDGAAPPTSGIAPLYFLDAAQPMLMQTITSADRAPGATYKFVQVEVAEVINPNQHPLTFEVHYERDGAERIHLGNFSLYPADHPGRFIVPTQGRVGDEGAIAVRMTSPDSIDRSDPLRISICRIQFVNR